MLFSGSSYSLNKKMKDKLFEDRKDAILRFPPPPPPPPSSHHQHHLECFSDEVDSRGSVDPKKQPVAAAADADDGRSRALAVAAAAAASGGGGGDGASIEVAKRRRGRPPGSKNKPKPPVVITREAEPVAAMRPHVLEIPGGRDVADALARFSRRRNLGICVLAGTGAVSNVTLRHPTQPPPPAGAAAVVFHGRYEILSMSATFLPPAMSAVAPAAAAAAAGLSISLAGPHGQIVGGAVAGPLFAAGTVVVVAAAFTNPTFHRLPAEEDASVSVSVSVSGSGEADDADHRRAARLHHGRQHHQQQQELEHHHVGHQHHAVAATQAAAAAAAAAAGESCGGMAIYSCHPPHSSEVIWAPTARAPHPPPY